MEKLIIVSSDGHAVMPPETWAKYLDPEYHLYLERLRNEKEMFTGSMTILNDARLSKEAQKVFDKEGAYGSGQWNGLWNREIRLQEMDREGVAAEFIFPGDFRASELFHSTMNGTYNIAAIDPGARAFNRWLLDEFGPAKERFLLVGAPISGLDLEGTIKEIHWMADNGFTGIFTPGYCALPGHAPAYDAYWDPLWAAFAERGIVLITHAGWGLPQGFAMGEIEAAAARVKVQGGGEMDLAMELARSVFKEKGVFADLRARRGMLHFMLGGVFDRHPKLKMMVTEIRADWMPAAFRSMDKIWEENRAKLPAKKPPSEYWRSNCMAGLSFMNKAEIAMRDEIGIETMAFGRDYPHTEATWPNTIPYLSDVLRGVPEKEVRAILGENAIRFLNLDRAKLAKIAERIAPTYKQIAEGPGLEPDLLAHMNARCGYSNPSEGDERLSELEALMRPDVPRIAAAAPAFA
jgi:predicted TIM-barrel fold metal-dependent hydrolase